MSTSPVGSKTTASSQAAPAPSDKAAASKKLPYPTQVVKTPTAKKVGSLQRRATIVNDDTLKAFFKSQEEKNTSEPSETRARSNSEAGVRGSINLDNVAALPVSDIAKYTAMTWQEKLEELGFAHLDKMAIGSKIRLILGESPDLWKHGEAETIAKAIAAKLPNNPESWAVIGEGLFEAIKQDIDVNSPRGALPAMKPDSKILEKMTRVLAVLDISPNTIGVLFVFADKCPPELRMNLHQKILFYPSKLGEMAKQALAWELNKPNVDVQAFLRGGSLCESLWISLVHAHMKPQLDAVLQCLETSFADRAQKGGSVNDYCIDEENVMKLPEITSQQLLNTRLEIRARFCIKLLQTMLNAVYREDLPEEFRVLLKERWKMVNDKFPALANQMLINVIFLHFINFETSRKYNEDAEKSQIVKGLTQALMRFCNGTKPKQGVVGFEYWMSVDQELEASTRKEHDAFLTKIKQ